jgi:hypothetical protein
MVYFITMILNESFIIFYLVFVFVCNILFKDNLLPNKLEDIGQKLNNNWFLVGASECLFCMKWWIAVCMAVWYSVYMYDYQYLIWAVYCSSISSILNK